METILVYNIKQKDKIIGKLKNISKNETLRNIRPYLKKMADNNEFISIQKNNDIKIIDKDIEDDFILEDILINENGEFKIYINGEDRSELNNNINNNINATEHSQNQQAYINYYNNNLTNNNHNRFIQFQSNNQ